MRALLTPEIAPRMGVVLFRPGSELMPLFMLGRTGMVLGNAGTATGAYANAYRLDPKNRDAALGYAEALTRSSDPEDHQPGKPSRDAAAFLRVQIP